MFLDKKAKQVCKPRVVTTVVTKKEEVKVEPVVEVKKTSKKTTKVEDTTAIEQ